MFIKWNVVKVNEVSSLCKKKNHSPCKNDKKVKNWSTKTKKMF